MSAPWTWATGTARERANMVRAHRDCGRPLSFDQIRDLFHLTNSGLDKILNGDDWRPEYERRPEVSASRRGG